jgi:hypothetical protein
MSSSVNSNTTPLLKVRVRTVRHGDRCAGRDGAGIGAGTVGGGGGGGAEMIRLWARIVEADPLESVSVVPPTGSTVAVCLHVRLSTS